VVLAAGLVAAVLDVDGAAPYRGVYGVMFTAGEADASGRVAPARAACVVAAPSVTLAA
jgi:hypothetical protein